MILLLALTFWPKVGLIAAVIIAGIIIACLRAAADMFDNWETGYGSGTERATIQCLAILVVAIAVALTIGLSGCCDFRDISGVPCGTYSNGEQKPWYAPGTVDPYHPPATVEDGP